MDNKTLPYIAAALLCEKVLQEKDEVISIMRIVDRLQYRVEGLPPGVKPIVNLQGLIMLKSGPVSGEHTVTIVAERPNGERKELNRLPIVLRGKDYGHNIILNLGLGVEQDGLYWFDVLFDGDVLSRIPITVSQLQNEQVQKI